MSEATAVTVGDRGFEVTTRGVYRYAGRVSGTEDCAGLIGWEYTAEEMADMREIAEVGGHPLLDGVSGQAVDAVTDAARESYTVIGGKLYREGSEAAKLARVELIKSNSEVSKPEKIKRPSGTRRVSRKVSASEDATPEYDALAAKHPRELVADVMAAYPEISRSAAKRIAHGIKHNAPARTITPDGVVDTRGREQVNGPRVVPEWRTRTNRDVRARNYFALIPIAVSASDTGVRYLATTRAGLPRMVTVAL